MTTPIDVTSNQQYIDLKKQYDDQIAQVDGPYNYVKDRCDQMDAIYDKWQYMTPGSQEYQDAQDKYDELSNDVAHYDIYGTIRQQVWNGQDPAADLKQKETDALSALATALISQDSVNNANQAAQNTPPSDPATPPDPTSGTTSPPDPTSGTSSPPVPPMPTIIIFFEYPQTHHHHGHGTHGGDASASGDGSASGGGTASGSSGTTGSGSASGTGNTTRSGNQTDGTDTDSGSGAASGTGGAQGAHGGHHAHRKHHGSHGTDGTNGSGGTSGTGGTKGPSGTTGTNGASDAGQKKLDTEDIMTRALIVMALLGNACDGCSNGFMDQLTDNCDKIDQLNGLAQQVRSLRPTGTDTTKTANVDANTINQLKSLNVTLPTDLKQNSDGSYSVSQADFDTLQNNVQSQSSSLTTLNQNTTISMNKAIDASQQCSTFQASDLEKWAQLMSKILS
ncbi:hypothetical protein [Peristeroidobacter soli]|uniref:hypothetical protein n=1 Tax=Peristeroidobacter soli TaxID=2497877 RepID=UPI00101CB0DD|nr:hypothetical protein [Peristeroidobacter soli]